VGAAGARATRNLFIGNLDHNVSEVELRRAFEKYGIIEEVVIKRPARGQGGAYAFLKFQNLDMAHRAKVAMSGRVVGRNPIKIGYGKANPTTRLFHVFFVCHTTLLFLRPIILVEAQHTSTKVLRFLVSN
uniref:RRM domain-containing protein n=1 Tax=Phasianus colchicus TaxID=9054 RepID=A0A669Q2V0_PHACC